MINLEDLYQDIILDHYRSPRNKGELLVPGVVEVKGFNPFCGDEVVIYLSVKDGVVDDVKVQSRGCSISTASGSLMGAGIKGRTTGEVDNLLMEFKSMMVGDEAAALKENGLGEVVALSGVVKFPARIKCAMLAWDTLEEALEKVEVIAT